MSEYKTEAILLAVRDYGDTDRMVTLFSRDYGKLTTVAYGARRPRSALAGSCQPFVHADLSLMTGKNLELLRQCEIRRSFRELREDLDKMAYANFLAELTAELWPERVADVAAFDLLLACFDVLAERNPRITALAAAVQLLALAGLRPELDNCLVCGQPIAFPAHFDPRAGGALCLSCATESQLAYTEDIKLFIERLSDLDWQSPGHFTVTGAVLLQAEKLLTDFMIWHLERPLKSLAFIATIAQG